MLFLLQRKNPKQKTTVSCAQHFCYCTREGSIIPLLIQFMVWSGFRILFYRKGSPLNISALNFFRYWWHGSFVGNGFVSCFLQIWTIFHSVAKEKEGKLSAFETLDIRILRGWLLFLCFSSCFRSSPSPSPLPPKTCDTEKEIKEQH